MSKSMTKKRKIIFDASPMLVNRTGVGYYTERLVANLAHDNPDDIFIGFYFNFLGRRSAAHFPKAPNIKYKPVRLLPSKIVYQLRRWHIEVPVEVLSKTKADFILYPNFLGYPSLFKSPSAPVVHDLTYLDLPQYVSAKNQQDLERFVPKEIARSAFAITVSEFSKQKICDAYNVNPGNVLVTPIPPPKPTPVDPKIREQALHNLGIKSPFILSLGTIEPRKNIPKLLEGFAKMPANLRDQYSLVVAGRVGWNCQDDLAALKKAGQMLNIKHVGYVSDQDREILLQSATLFASASHYEGFGMPVLEAMNYGTPCILSNIKVYHEVAGDAAIYFDQDSPENIARGLARVLSDPSQIKARRAQSLEQVSKFDWAKVTTKVAERIKASFLS